VSRCSPVDPSSSFCTCLDAAAAAIRAEQDRTSVRVQRNCGIDAGRCARSSRRPVGHAPRLWGQPAPTPCSERLCASPPPPPAAAAWQPEELGASVARGGSRPALAQGPAAARKRTDQHSLSPKRRTSKDIRWRLTRPKKRSSDQSVGGYESRRQPQLQPEASRNSPTTRNRRVTFTMLLARPYQLA